jgi:hypothetical protein
MTENCGQCRFWKPHEDNAFGDCRRHPPRVFIEPLVRMSDDNPDGDEIDRGDLLMATKFPPTYTDDWCGEYRRAPECAA